MLVFQWSTLEDTAEPSLNRIWAIHSCNHHSCPSRPRQLWWIASTTLHYPPSPSECELTNAGTWTDSSVAIGTMVCTRSSSGQDILEVRYLVNCPMLWGHSKSYLHCAIWQLWFHVRIQLFQGSNLCHTQTQKEYLYLPAYACPLLCLFAPDDLSTSILATAPKPVAGGWSASSSSVSWKETSGGVLIGDSASYGSSRSDGGVHSGATSLSLLQKHHQKIHHGHALAP